MTLSFITVAFFSLLGLAAWRDVRTRRIPNVLTVSGVMIALALRSFVGSAAVIDGLQGIGVALLLVIPLMALGGFGGGDAKLLLAVGAFMGPQSFLIALSLTALIGCVMALWEAWRSGRLYELTANTASLGLHLVTFGRRGRRRTLATEQATALPYGVAIAMGSALGWVIQ